MLSMFLALLHRLHVLRLCQAIQKLELVLPKAAEHRNCEVFHLKGQQKLSIPSIAEEMSGNSTSGREILSFKKKELVFCGCW